VKQLVASGVLAAALASPLSATADDTTECPVDAGPWLRLNSEASLPPALAAGVADRLRAELHERAIALCTANEGDGTRWPLAEIELRIDPDDVLALAVVDRATEKRLERSLSLRGIPSDARALAIALAADELLRASWLESLLERSGPRPETSPAPPPPVVERVAVESLSVRARAPRDVGGYVGFAVAAEHATGGLSLGGFDARLSYGATFRAGIRAGYRIGAVVNADHGEIGSSALVGGVVLEVATPRASPWGATLFARGDAMRVAFSGQATNGARASNGSDVGALAGAGVGGWRSLDPSRVWRLVVEISVAVPLRGVAALDNGRSVTALSGAVLGLGLGVGAAL